MATEADSSDDDAGSGDAPLVRVGCAGLPSGISRATYFERLDLLETDVTFFEPPREVALRRWHTEAPAGSAFSVLAWQLITHDPGNGGHQRLTTPLAPEIAAQTGGFRDTPVVREAWQRTLASARALGAEVILFQTPPSFTPTDTNRDALRRFCGEIAAEHDDMTLAWEPHGLWEPQQASALANEIGLVYALDPLQLETPPPDEPRAYFRLHGLGIYRGKLGDDLLELLADMVDSYERAWVVFANVEKLGDAQRFHRLLGGRAFVDDED